MRYWSEFSPTYRVVIGSLVAVLAAGLLALLVFGIASCGVPDWLKGAPKSGTVVSKRHEPGHWYDQYNSCKYQTPVIRTRVVSNPNGGTSVETYTDMQCQGGYDHLYDDEDWKLLLKQCKQKSDGTTGKCRSGWREIHRERFATLSVGDYYDGKDNE